MNKFTLVFSTRQESEQIREFIPTPRPIQKGKVIGFKNGHKYEPSAAYLEYAAKMKKI